LDCFFTSNASGLFAVALHAVGAADWGIDYEAILRMAKLEMLSPEQWEGV